VIVVLKLKELKLNKKNTKIKNKVRVKKLNCFWGNVTNFLNISFSLTSILFYIKLRNIFLVIMSSGRL